MKISFFLTNLPQYGLLRIMSEFTPTSAQRMLTWKLMGTEPNFGCHMITLLQKMKYTCQMLIWVNHTSPNFISGDSLDRRKRENDRWAALPLISRTSSPQACSKKASRSSAWVSNNDQLTYEHIYRDLVDRQFVHVWMYIYTYAWGAISPIWSGWLEF